MGDYVKSRSRDREASAFNTYDVVMNYRKDYVEQQMKGKVVIRSTDREWEMTRQGKLKYYLQPHQFDDHALRDWMTFVQDIRKHSGSHRHQGGLVIFVLEGKGYTVVDNKRYDWEAGDLLLLPPKPDGVEHQHFNAEEGSGCKWVAFIYMPIWDAVSGEMTQGQLSPDYKK